MKNLPAGPNKFSIVDDDVFAALSKMKWNVQSGKCGTYYAYRIDRQPQGQRKTYRHRHLMNAPRGMMR